MTATDEENSCEKYSLEKTQSLSCNLAKCTIAKAFVRIQLFVV